MREVVAETVRSVAATWRQEATNRRRYTKLDPGADTLEFCASELEAELERVLDASRLLTVEQWAKAHHTNPSTVRRWCARGELEAEKTDGGEWMIPRSARRQRKAG